MALRVLDRFLDAASTSRTSNVLVPGVRDAAASVSGDVQFARGFQTVAVAAAAEAAQAAFKIDAQSARWKRVTCEPLGSVSIASVMPDGLSVVGEGEGDGAGGPGFSFTCEHCAVV